MIRHDTQFRVVGQFLDSLSGGLFDTTRGSLKNHHVVLKNQDTEHNLPPSSERNAEFEYTRQLSESRHVLSVRGVYSGYFSFLSNTILIESAEVTIIAPKESRRRAFAIPWKTLLMILAIALAFAALVWYLFRIVTKKRFPKTARIQYQAAPHSS